MALADQIGEDISGGAVVLHALGKLVTLCLDCIVLGKFLLNFQLLLLSDQSLGVHFLLGTATLRTNFQHMGS